MNSTKKWYQSATIWSILAAAGGFVLSTYLKADVTVPENADFNQLKAYAEAIKAANGNLGVIIGQLIAAVGTVAAIYNRIKTGAKIVK